MNKLKVLHMYDDILDLYGDRGNIATLRYRAKKRGIDFEFDTCTIGEKKKLTDYNLIFMGGGADREQRLVAEDLKTRKEAFQEAANQGVQHLLICGAYQLFGQYYIDSAGEYLEGLGIGDFYTMSSGTKRCIGDILVSAQLGGEDIEIVGFENHSGQTLGVKNHFAEVKVGHGNLFHASSPEEYQSYMRLEGESKHSLFHQEKGFTAGFEGYMKGSVIGTYMHGPLLPKNPKLADYLIKQAIGVNELKPLDDTFEQKAFLKVKSLITKIC